ncbi:MAG: esterase family protein [Clostridia bacterium]|nr:esterase family protein [Clostridia bacterium]
MALVKVNYSSKVLGMGVTVDVILPQKATRLIGMETAEREGGTPVLWLLHGASDDETIWQRRTSIERYAAPLGLAVVMPGVQLSSYSDMAHGGKYYTFVSKELPEVMHNMFGFSTKREDNFIAGLSMGGAGCMKIGLANPEKYAAIGCMSAGITNRAASKKPPKKGSGMQGRMYMTYGDRDLRGTEEDPEFQAKSIIAEGKPIPRIYHTCGSEDFLVERAHYTRDFFLGFEGNPFDYTYEEDPGAHTCEYWDEHIQHFLKFIGLETQSDIRN